MKEGMHSTLAAASATLPAREQLKRAFWCQLGGCRVDKNQHNHKRQHQNACTYIYKVFYNYDIEDNADIIVEKKAP